MLFSTILSIAALASLSVAAPSGGGMQVIVKNQCGYDITVSKLANGQPAGTKDPVPKGSSKTYPLPENWQGRFFGRNGCSGPDCTSAGTNDPASLAEFTFRGAGGKDFYDVSFVDGFNLPIKIVPIGGKGGGDKYQCGSPTCAALPACPKDMTVNINGKFASCQSACSKYHTDEYCCTGAHNTPDKCPPNKYSKAVKQKCPDVYSYAYDDKTSTYTCVAQGYNIVFCP